MLASHLWPLAEEANPLQPIARTLFHEGYAGVSFFFMLSGFILSHTYQAKLTSGAISRGKYLALRVGRIAPLHWLTGLPFAIWALATIGPGTGWASVPTSLVNLALLQSWVPDEHWYFTLNEPSWSLSDELFFYTMFAGLAFLPLRRLGAFAALLALGNGGLVLWLVSHGQGAITLPDGAMTRTHWLTYIAPLPRLLDFVVGMLVYRAPRFSLGRFRLGPTANTALEAGTIALLLAAMVAYPLLGLAEAWRMQLAYLPLMALVIWSFGSGGGQNGGALSGFLARNTTLVLLGDASFALYLIHLPVIHAALALRDRFEDGLPLLPLCGATTLVAVGLSVLVYRAVEVPLLARTRRLIARAFPGG